MDEIIKKDELGISISIVSHAQIGLVANLLKDINEHCKDSALELVLTLNLDETLPFAVEDFSFPVKIIRNALPIGFGANHNQAFTYATNQFFCVMNPDIRLNDNPFPKLCLCLQEQSVGIAAPLVLDMVGEIEDSARCFPSPLKILHKVVDRRKGHDYVMTEALIYPDWVGGMFMLFSRNSFARLGGFDRRYFLYYEDVDICARLRLLGYEVVLCPKAKVIHHAQRSSHRNFRYLRWHLRSMMRFFLSPVYWKLQRRKWMWKLGANTK